MIYRILLFTATALLLAACGKQGQPQVSSESHWLTCVTFDDCTSEPEAVACSKEGFCINAEDERFITDSGSVILDSRMARGIEEAQVDGIWIFRYTPDGAVLDGRHGGTAFVVDDCLFVGDKVVIWDESRTDDAQALITEIAAGARPSVVVIGSSIDELATTIVMERCSTTAVWFASSDPLQYVDAGI